MKNNKPVVKKQKVKKPKIERSILFHQINKILVDYSVIEAVEITEEIEKLFQELTPLDKQFQVLDFDIIYIISKCKPIDNVRLGNSLSITKEISTNKIIVSITNNVGEISILKTFLNNTFAHRWINENFGLISISELKTSQGTLLTLINSLNNDLIKIRLINDTYLHIQHKNNTMLCMHYVGDEFEGQDVVKIFTTLESFFKYVSNYSMECIKSKLIEINTNYPKLKILEKIQ